MTQICLESPKNGTRTLEKQNLKSIVIRRKTYLDPLPSLTKNKGLYVKSPRIFPQGYLWNITKPKVICVWVIRDSNVSSLIE